jgi:hypothetical protein
MCLSYRGNCSKEYHPCVIHLDLLCARTSLKSNGLFQFRLKHFVDLLQGSFFSTTPRIAGKWYLQLHLLSEFLRNPRSGMTISTLQQNGTATFPGAVHGQIVSCDHPFRLLPMNVQTTGKPRQSKLMDSRRRCLSGSLTM